MIKPGTITNSVFSLYSSSFTFAFLIIHFGVHYKIEFLLAMNQATLCIRDKRYRHSSLSVLLRASLCPNTGGGGGRHSGKKYRREWHKAK